MWWMTSRGASLYTGLRWLSGFRLFSLRWGGSPAGWAGFEAHLAACACAPQPTPRRCKLWLPSSLR